VFITSKTSKVAFLNQVLSGFISNAWVLFEILIFIPWYRALLQKEGTELE
jgi:hypothetical protein